MRKRSLHALCLCAPLLIMGCVTRPPEKVADPTPTNWHVPLPHEGAVTLLADWWRQLDDPLLVALIESAQAESPTIASAASRIADARAARVAAGAALAPNLNGNLQASRGNTLAAAAPSPNSSIAPITTLQAGLQSSWEIDLFGGLRASRDSAQAQLDSANAQWHAARVSVAADTATTYFDERACQRELLVSESDARSRSETARLTELAAKAGFQAPADAARAVASASDAAARLTQQKAQCTVLRKALVALTGMDAAALDQKLDQASINPSLPTINAIEAVPAAALAQRPDVYSAELGVASASAEAGAAQARRYPRLTLQGSIAALQFRMGAFRQTIDTWSIGPLALEIPIFDGGTRAANAEAAQVRYDEAVVQYRSTVRQAVREVEVALVNLQSTDARFADAESAVRNFQISFNATQARYDSGLASLFELEDARRTLFVSQLTLVGLQRSRAEAFVTLYRSMGGGWQRPDATALSSASTSP
ncbi:efflux transporter outer membrane subunit [Variovorax sp. J22R133]|uniref:efflux transporter outer membrane subunit n=1 Tax=Variovorax brevis TaxID=3053503 RepID=UPI0025778E5A|nr:efflux transporter outer membrane subunit [Variovorax sp. J22R133]MDM0112589.1 efflux transporter outer membrane subunit [Variovorax sp. J22R133]